MLTDQDFADTAQPTCGTLNGGIIAFNGVLDFKLIAAEYQKTPNSLGKLNITEASAPKGYQLRTSMADLDNAIEAFQPALDTALSEAGPGACYTLMSFEGGQVTAYKGSIFDITALNIDPELANNVFVTLSEVQSIATELDLLDCAVNISAQQLPKSLIRGLQRAGFFNLNPALVLGWITS